MYIYSNFFYIFIKYPSIVNSLLTFILNTQNIWQNILQNILKTKQYTYLTEMFQTYFTLCQTEISGIFLGIWMEYLNIPMEAIWECT